ncbi:MAG: mechanosensitive ion channel family protein [Gemmatimonadetes bacterium]|nr:mechanosensitive ion channel family protein [Gemmatimonadota bacterium]
MNLEAILNALLFPAVGALAGALAGVFARSVVLPRMARVAERTDNKLDDIILGAGRGPVVLWAVLLGLYIGITFAGYEQNIIEAIRRPLLAVVIMSVSWTLASVVSAMIKLPQGPSGAVPSARILSTAAQASVLAVGFLVALQTLGVSVTPILTALGVGGLAVGLALQDTLANLFAGFHILVSGQLRPGDFIELESGAKGFVEDITWRNTTIRQLPNNLLIIPNAKLSQSITINYTLPETQQSMLVPVGVSYDDDLEHVERVTIEVARTIQADVEGAVRDFEPVTRYNEFADSSINFNVIMRAEQYTNMFLMRHEFVKRLHERYRAEGISIPYPQRTVHLNTVPPAAPEAP